MTLTTLDSLRPGQRGSVARIAEANPAMAAQLREIGFAEGDDVELLHVGPVGGQPLCFRLNSTMIALRRGEAAMIEIDLPGDSRS